MSEDLKIKSVMTIFPHSVGVDQTLEIAKQMMGEHDIRHLPVQKRRRTNRSNNRSGH